MEGRVSEVQTAAFLIGLRTKGETVDEVAGLASTMRDLALRVEVDRGALVDTAGTGGGAPSFNVSTTAALLAAAAGATIAKHGNRSATGRCGSGDALEAVRARHPLSPRRVRRGRRLGGARRPHRLGACRDRRVHRRRGLRLHVRADAPPGDALRRPGAP